MSLRSMLRSLTLTALTLVTACGINLGEMVGKDDESESKGSEEPETADIPDTGCADALVQESYPERYVYQDCVLTAGATELVLPITGEPNLTTVTVTVDGVALAAGEFTATYDAAAKSVTIKSDKFAGASLVDVTITGAGTVVPPPQDGDLYFGYLMQVDEETGLYKVHAAHGSIHVLPSLDITAFVNQHVGFRYVPDPCSGWGLLCDSIPTVGEIVPIPTDLKDAVKCDSARGKFEAVKTALAALAGTCEVDADCARSPQRVDSCPQGVPYNIKDIEAVAKVARMHGANAEVVAYCPIDAGGCADLDQPIVCQPTTKTCVEGD